MEERVEPVQLTSFGFSLSGFPPTETCNPGRLVHEGNEQGQALPCEGRSGTGEFNSGMNY